MRLRKKPAVACAALGLCMAIAVAGISGCGSQAGAETKGEVFGKVSEISADSVTIDSMSGRGGRHGRPSASDGAVTGSAARPDGIRDGAKATERKRPDGQKAEKPARPDGAVTGSAVRPDGIRDGDKTTERKRPDGQKAEKPARPDGAVTGSAVRPDGQKTDRKKPDGSGSKIKHEQKTYAITASTVFVRKEGNKETVISASDIKSGDMIKVEVEGTSATKITVIPKPQKKAET